MANLTDYFEKTTYKAKYLIGDRVFGYYNDIPFIGKILLDNLVSLEYGPRLIVSLDLPIYFNNNYITTIIDKHKSFKSLKKLTDYSALEADRIAKASKTNGSGFDSHQAHQKTKRKSK